VVSRESKATVLMMCRVNVATEKSTQANLTQIRVICEICG
jgi:hypothetical protein